MTLLFTSQLNTLSPELSASSYPYPILTIGTPSSSSATKVLFCDSGELGKEVVIELQRFGCEVIACDRYENAPAIQVADRSYSFSMLDGDEPRV